MSWKKKLENTINSALTESEFEHLSYEHKFPMLQDYRFLLNHSQRASQLVFCWESEPWLGRNPIARSGVQPAGSGISCTENNFSIRYGNGSFSITFYTVILGFVAVDDQIWTALITLYMLSCHLNKVCVNTKIMGLLISYHIDRKVHMIWQVHYSWLWFFYDHSLFTIYSIFSMNYTSAQTSYAVENPTESV